MGLSSSQPREATLQFKWERECIVYPLKYEKAKPDGKRDDAKISRLERELLQKSLVYQKFMCEYASQSAHEYDTMVTQHSASPCLAGDWVRQRAAVSERAMLEFWKMCVKQTEEELRAMDEQRPPILVAVPCLHLELPSTLQQEPSRHAMYMCYSCRKFLERIEYEEEEVHGMRQFFLEAHMESGMLPDADMGAPMTDAAEETKPADAVGQQGNADSPIGVLEGQGRQLRQPSDEEHSATASLESSPMWCHTTSLTTGIADSRASLPNLRLRAVADRSRTGT